MSREVAQILATGFAVGCAFIMLGMWFSSNDGVTSIGLNWLGEGIGKGIAHAACIEAGRDWNPTGSGWCSK